MTKTRKPFTYFMLATAGIIGGGGLMIFMVFLLLGSLKIVDFEFGNVLTIIFDIFLCFLFFAQHSLMAREPFRRWLKSILPSPYYGAFYAVASGIAVLILVFFWQDSSIIIFSIQGIAGLLFRGIFILAIAGVAWTILSLGFLANFRLQSIVDELRGRKSTASLVTNRGPYRWIRHPLYLSSLLMIWSIPVLTLDRVLFNFLFTIWVVIAILLEEQDLFAQFGKAYRTYQEKVPMLVPLSMKLRNLKETLSMSAVQDGFSQVRGGTRVK